ncbi:NnrS family protein [Planctomycetales bacterium ZRK34]|nr:NnrS family protein [Planctomycetales bacterium ZRK34]
MAKRPQQVVPLAVKGVAAGADKNSMPLWAMGFRPFFLLAGVSAIMLVAVWVGIYRGEWIAVAPGRYFDIFTWHYHEMIFAFTTAVIAGFLLTAASNWTGMRTAHGPWLMALVGLWLAGRVAILSGEVMPEPLIAAIDIAFLPALIAAVAVPIIQTQNWRNLVFIVLLLAMTIANVMMHLQAMGIAAVARPGAFFAVYLVMIMIAIVGGRVFPYFASKRLPEAKVKRYPALEIASIATLVALTLAELVAPTALEVIALLAALAAVAHTLRFVGWCDRRVWGVPLLWVLYTGYAWLIIALIMRAAAARGYVMPMLPTHAMTVGAIGVLTMGMMARVSLGHTARELKASKITIAAFVVINLAAVVRVLGPMVVPQKYAACVSASGVLWAIAFVLFLIVYTPIFIKPREDGRIG